MAQPLFADSGAAIYEHGETVASKVFIGTNKAPSTLFPCINCHLGRGTGSKEAGIIAPNITWNQLIQPYRKDFNGTRKRTSYGFDSFKKALLEGINSDAESLSNSMPRYLLSDEEIQSLIIYLQQIDQRTQRGVEDTKIHFWLRLPENPEMADILRDTVSVFVNEFNNQGGVYRRQLLMHEYTTEEAAYASVFCILDLRMLYVQDQADLHHEMIVVGVFSPDHIADTAYFLYSHPATYDLLKSVLAKEYGWHPLEIKNQDLDSIVKTLKVLNAARINSTVLIHQSGNRSLKSLIESLKAAQTYPRILTDLQALSPHIEQLIAHYPAPVFTITPPGPESVSEQGRRILHRLSTLFKGPKHYFAARLWSLALMNLLVTTLQQSGRELNKDEFIKVLQSQVDLDTGFSPPLSYSANRRTGNIGAMLVQLN